MIRNESINKVTSVSVSKSQSIIYARTEDMSSSSTFDIKTGDRLWGTLDLTPEEILYLVWRQQQSPTMSERALRMRWNVARWNVEGK